MGYVLAVSAVLEELPTDRLFAALASEKEKSSKRNPNAIESQKQIKEQTRKKNNFVRFGCRVTLNGECFKLSHIEETTYEAILSSTFVNPSTLESIKKSIQENK